MGKILVAYASKTGSTKEVAEEMGRVISGKGFQVDVRPVSAVGALDDYDGVIVGAPINGMRWLPEAIRFVEMNKVRLASVPTAYFLLSVAITGKSLFTKKVFSSLDPVSAIVKPIGTGFFGGHMSSEPPFILRLAFGLKKDAPKDARDWKSIREWAEKTADSMGKAGGNAAGGPR